MSKYEQHREAVEGFLRHPVSDAVWRRVIDDYHSDLSSINLRNPDDVQTLAEDVADVESTERYFVEASQQVRLPRSQSRPVAYAGGALQQVMGLVLLLRLRRDVRVQEFRATELGGTLLPAFRLSEWLGNHLGEIVKWHDERLDNELGLQPSPAKGPTLTLSTMSPARALVLQRSEAVQEIDFLLETVEVAEGGVLDRLRVLSRAIGEDLRIPSHQAARSILSDEPPVIPLAVTGRSGDTWPSSIALTIETNMTPQEVAALYAQERKRRGTSPIEPKGDKTWSLLAFALDRERRGFSDSWEGLRVAWNKDVAERESNYRMAGGYLDDPDVGERLQRVADAIQGASGKPGWRYRSRSQVSETVRSARFQVEAYLFG